MLVIYNLATNAAKAVYDIHVSISMTIFGVGILGACTKNLLFNSPHVNVRYGDQMQAYHEPNEHLAHGYDFA